MRIFPGRRKQAAQIPDFAPSDISQDAQREFFERGTRPAIERNRWFFISVMLAAALIADGFAWNIALPLQKIEVFGVNKVEGGRLVADQEPVGYWTPDKDSLAFHLNEWATNCYDVTRSTIDKTLTKCGEIVIGSAVAQLREQRSKDNPILKLRDNPTYTRNYEYRSINWIKDDVALLRFKTIARNNDDAQETNYAMTITFTRVKPKTREQVIRNPAGMFITNFSVTEESSK